MEGVDLRKKRLVRKKHISSDHPKVIMQLSVILKL